MEEPDSEAIVDSDVSEEYAVPRGKGKAAAKTKEPAKPRAPARKASKAAAPEVTILDDSDEDSAPSRNKRPAPAITSPETGSVQKKARKLPGSITGGASKASVISKWK